MRRLFFLLLLLTGIANTVFATDGYRIQLQLGDTKDSVIYLAHYFGKPLPTIYKIDSARINKNGEAILESSDTTLGGIYILLMQNHQNYLEFLLNNGDSFGISASSNDLLRTVKFKNSPENDRFLAYINSLETFGKNQAQYTADLQRAKTKADSNIIFEKSSSEGKAVEKYRKDYVKKYPGTLMANIFRALEAPHGPEPKAYLPDGREDSVYNFNYYKQHYWDGFDFSDDRLINTPIYDSKLENYINNLVVHTPDSVNKEADMLLAKAKKSKELYKYTLHWFAQYAQDSKIMGMDEVFVYLVENYHMKGEAYWLEPDMLKKYIDRARSLAPTAIGNVGADLKMTGTDNKEYSLHGVKAKYTLLVFWSPECGSCRTEMPKIDSLYEAVLKKKDVKVFAVRTEGEEAVWKEAIAKDKLDDWINVYDPEKKSNFRSKYDVYSTPKVFLLDERKIIRGKKLDHSNIARVIEILELQSQNGNNKL